MNPSEFAELCLNIQAGEIAKMTSRTEPFNKTLAGVDITVLPKVYHGGLDSELTCAAIGDCSNKSILDLGTGTGIVAVKAGLAGASRVVAVDLNPEAVKNAKINARRHRLGQIEVLEGSLFEPIGTEAFDIIALNPPYTAKKPTNKAALAFWDENNQTTRRFFEEYKRHLKPGGRTYLTWADFSPTQLIEDIAQDNSTVLRIVQSRRNGSGIATFLVYELIGT